MQVHNNSSEPWKITLVDTGLNATTGTRIKKAKKHIGDEAFSLTYGDGVADIDIKKRLIFTLNMTMTSAQPDGTFGALNIGKMIRL